MTADYNSKLKSNLYSHEQSSSGLHWRQSRLMIKGWQTGAALLLVYRCVAMQACYMKAVNGYSTSETIKKVCYLKVYLWWL